MSDYIPISCSLYDLLEAAATQHILCDIVYCLDDSTYQVSGRIVDLFSKKEVEYLRLENGAEIRLDTLVTFNGQAFGGQA